jgi:hypothetical protein
MTMGALDTARLVLLFAGTKHELWRARTAAGSPPTPS